jgi:hypothetical protein
MASMMVVAVAALALLGIVQRAGGDGLPVPGESSIYNTYTGVAPPYPGNETSPILPTSSGPAGPDEILFQNLLASEWAIYSFYQQGLEVYTAANFTDAGYLNSTYTRIAEIRDNEAGHLLIIREQISNHSIAPGACKYQYPYYSPASYLVLQTVIEFASMAFLSGLVPQAKLDISKSALVAISQTETRHLTWGLIDNWNIDPFSGPSDTIYPYANQVLDVTNQFVIPGSCPTANPPYPYPSQHRPQLSHTSPNLLPGSNITFTYNNASNVPSFDANKQYYAVFFHGLLTISNPFDPATNSSTIPSQFEEKGIIMAVIADVEGAPTQQSVLAGPNFILLQPAGLY